MTKPSKAVIVRFATPKMTQQTTTKPMRSRAQWRFLFANGMPFARRWAHATPGGKGTRFRKLPPKVTKKAPNYGARAGQTIAGRLRRGSSGRFESAGGASPAPSARQRKPTARRVSRAAPKPKKPAKTEAQRAQERAQRQAERQQARTAEQEQNIAKTFDALGLSEDAADSLKRLAAGEAVDDDGGLVKMGLAEQAKDGSYRLNAKGRQVMNAAERGDVGMARDVMSKAAETAATPAGGGGGGGKKKKPDKKPKMPRSGRAPKRAQAPTGGGGGSREPKPELPRNLVDAARALSQGQPADVQLLIRNGLARRNREGRIVLTAAGLRAIREKATGAAGDYLVVEDRDKPSTWHLQVKRNGTPDHRLMGAAWAALHGGYRGNTYAGPDKGAALSKLRALYAREGMPVPTEKASSFAVYKDASGNLRWVAYSSNAYRDRDSEIVSTKALEEDCARADKDGKYGPLRWWHVGGPAGPGWDLGMCDFNAMHGRVLVESGTFKTASIGAAVAKAAPQLQLSIGFTHAPSEPDRDGVFHHIRRFERSLVPIGRAANPFTKLSVVKESGMDNEKETALKATLGDAAAAEVLAGAEATQKDADAQGIAYKADDPWAAVLTALKGAVAAMITPPQVEPPAEPATEKAGPPAEAKADFPAGDMGGGEVVEEAVEEVAEETDPGEMTYDEFIAEIRRVVREELGAELKAQLAPLAGMLDIEKKVSGAVQSLMQPYQAQQATKDDARAQEIASLKARLSELEGDVPNVFRQPFTGYRPSQASDTVVAKADAPGGAPQPLDPSQPTDDDPFADIKAGLFGSTNGHTPGV